MRNLIILLTVMRKNHADYGSIFVTVQTTRLEGIHCLNAAECTALNRLIQDCEVDDAPRVTSAGIGEQSLHRAR